MSVSLRPLAWLALAAASAILGGCGNPAVDARIEALGEETPGGPSENHRPGQPCVLCHSLYGGAEPEMSIAGTLYATPDMVQDPNSGALVPPPPVANATVILYDSFGDRREAKTNCVGNFYITSDWQPIFPLYTEVEYDLPGSNPAQKKRTAMSSYIQREGSCNTCHLGDRNQGSAGRIYCLLTPPATPFEVPAGCQVSQ